MEGKISDGKPTVLFLCTHNAGRSQMALGFFTHLAGDQATAWSGGSEPGNEINPAAIAAMAEVGIDIEPVLGTDRATIERHRGGSPAWLHRVLVQAADPSQLSASARFRA